MTRLNLTRYAPSIGAAAALLAGCGAAQPPIGAPGPIAQTRAALARGDRSGSWMLPGAQNVKKLLYLSGWLDDNVYVYDYKSGQLVGTLSGFDMPGGQCVDKIGDIFITDAGNGITYEYEHGGAAPIAIFKTNGTYASGCSVNGRGDLAVTDYFVGSKSGQVCVWKRSRGSSTCFRNSACAFLYPAGYDSKGNLIAQSWHTVCAVLNGAKSMTILTFAGKIDFPDSTMWDGKYIALAGWENVGSYFYTTVIFETSLSGSTLISHGEIGLGDDCNYTAVLFPFIVGETNTPVNRKQGTIALGGNLQCATNTSFWRYPSGGDPFKVLNTEVTPQGQSVSIAP